MKIKITFNPEKNSKKKEHINILHIKLKEQKEHGPKKKIQKPSATPNKLSEHQKQENPENTEKIKTASQTKSISKTPQKSKATTPNTSETLSNIQLPEDKNLIKNLVNLFLVVGDLEKAKAILEKAVNLYKDDPEFLDTYAKVLL